MTTAPDPLRLTWRKSARSQANGSCVELGGDGNVLRAVRDSKDPTGQALVVDPAKLTSFIEAVKHGSYD